MWDAVYIFNEVFIDTETNTIVLVTVLWLLRDTIMAYSIGFWRTVLDYKSIIIMVGRRLVWHWNSTERFTS